MHSLPPDSFSSKQPDPQGALAALRVRAERRHLVTQSELPQTREEVQRLIQELQIHQIELEMQNEELLLAQAEAENSRLLYLDLYEFAPVGYCTVRADGTMQQLNLCLARLLHTVRAQLEGRRLGLFVALAHREQFTNFIALIFRNSQRQSITVEMHRPDGQPIYVRMEGVQAADGVGRPQARLALVDVTEQHQAMQALALSEQRFRTLFEENQDAMVLLRDNRFINCNKAALNLLGLHHKKQLLGQHAAAMSPERQPGGQLSVGLADVWWQQTLSRGHCRYEWCRTRANGQEFWEDIVQTSIPEAGGNIVHATWRDITAAKQAAIHLRENEQRLRQALDVSALGVIDWNLTSDELYWDERARTIFGYPYEPGSYTSAAALARVHPHDQTRLLHLIQSLSPGQTPAEIEYRVVRPSGEEAYVSMVGQIVSHPSAPGGRLLGLVRDITTHRAADLELSYKNRLLQHMLAHMPVLLARLTPAGRYVEMVGAGLRQLNLADNELAGHSIFEAFPAFTEPVRQLLMGQEVSFLGPVVVNEESVYFQNYGFFDTERNQGVVFAIDVTENERRRQQLQQEQQLMQSLLDSSIDAVIAIGADLRITSWNRQSEHFTSILAAQAVGRTMSEVIPALAQNAEFMALFDRALAGETVQYLSWAGRYFSGKLDLNLVPLTSTAPAAGVLILARDVTQREQLVAETTQLKLREQQLVLSAILTTQEEERRRIAEALHNGVGQLLYATNLHLDQLPPSEQVRSCKQILKEAVRATRNISFELTPGILEDFGLPTALRELTKRIPTSSLRVNMQLTGLENPLPSTLQTAIYRIVQELLNNVMKHAQAQQACVTVAHQNGVVQVSVQDDGIGFVVSDLKRPHGIGLAGTRNRIELLGGQLHITSAPAAGTTVNLTVPVPAQ